MVEEVLRGTNSAETAAERQQLRAVRQTLLKFRVNVSVAEPVRTLGAVWVLTDLPVASEDFETISRSIRNMGTLHVRGPRVWLRMNRTSRMSFEAQAAFLFVLSLVLLTCYWNFENWF